MGGNRQWDMDSGWPLAGSLPQGSSATHCLFFMLRSPFVRVPVECGFLQKSWSLLVGTPLGTPTTSAFSLRCLLYSWLQSCFLVQPSAPPSLCGSLRISSCSAANHHCSKPSAEIA